MTTAMSTQDERNRRAAALTELHVKVLSELARPLGFTLDTTREPETECFGKLAFKNGPRREYTLLQPGVDFGEIKILGPLPGNLSELELQQYFSAHLKLSMNIPR